METSSTPESAKDLIQKKIAAKMNMKAEDINSKLADRLLASVARSVSADGKLTSRQVMQVAISHADHDRQTSRHLTNLVKKTQGLVEPEKQLQYVTQAIMVSQKDSLVKGLSQSIQEAAGETVDFVKVSRIHSTIQSIVEPWKSQMTKIQEL